MKEESRQTRVAKKGKTTNSLPDSTERTQLYQLALLTQDCKIINNCKLVDLGINLK